MRKVILSYKPVRMVMSSGAVYNARPTNDIAALYRLSWSEHYREGIIRSHLKE